MSILRKASRKLRNIFRGSQGFEGPAGASAYDIWLRQGNSGTEQDFLKYLRLPEGGIR